MKSRLIAIVLASATFATATPALANNNQVTCRVVGVSDGDTLTCLSDIKTQYKVRLHGIDAPESKQDFGTQAKYQLANMVFGKDVTLNIKDTDRYGRTVADVLVNGKSANLTQVTNGYAWAYRSYLRGAEAQTYINAENQARNAKRGLWSMPNPINPADFRKQRKTNVIF